MPTRSAPPRHLQLTVLDPAQCDRVHAASLDLLETVGLRVGGRRALRALRDAGCRVTATDRVFVPPQVVDEALGHIPPRVVLHGRQGRPAMVLDDSNPLHFGTHADMLGWVAPGTDRVRPFRREDTRTICTLADALPNLDFVLSVGLASGVPPRIQSQVSFLETLTHFSKVINFSTNDVRGLEEIIDLAAIVAGGHDRLRAQPFLFHYCEPIPPLTHPAESTEKLITCALGGIPVVYMPFCMMGGTAPMSFAATLAQCNAEVLAGLVLTQLVAPGAAFIYGAMPSIMDMRTTIGSYGAAEFHLLVAAASQMAASYGLPFYGTAGCSDARTLDAQAVAETTMQIFSTFLSRANVVHDVGITDHCNNLCPELVVLADELIENQRHYCQGVRVDDATLALDLIAEVGPSGAYVDHPHTCDHFRDIHYPRLFSREMTAPEASPVRPRIVERITTILREHTVQPLADDVRQEVERQRRRIETC